MAKSISKIDNILTELGTNNSSQIATAVLAGFKMIFLPLATATDKNASPEQKKYTMIRDVIMEGLALLTYIGVTGQIQKTASAPIAALYYKDKAKKIKEGKINPAQALTSDEIQFLEKVDSKRINEAGKDFLTQISSKHKVMSKDTADYMKKLDGIVNKINGTTEVDSKLTIDEYISKLNKPGRTQDISASIIKDMKNSAKDSKKVLMPMKVYQNTRIALSQICVWTLALAIIPPMCNALIAPVMKKINEKENKKPVVNPSSPSFKMNKSRKNNLAAYNTYPPGVGMRV